MLDKISIVFFTSVDVLYIDIPSLVTPPLFSSPNFCIALLA